MSNASEIPRRRFERKEEMKDFAVGRITRVGLIFGRATDILVTCDCKRTTKAQNLTAIAVVETAEGICILNDRPDDRVKYEKGRNCF
jgi:hypothetical protein